MPPATGVDGSVIAADMGPGKLVHPFCYTINFAVSEEGEIEIDTARGRGVENTSDELKIAYLKFVQSK